MFRVLLEGGLVLLKLKTIAMLLKSDAVLFRSGPMEGGWADGSVHIVTGTAIHKRLLPGL